ncbi:hypothetical protein AWN76_002050 [Rhodothermaceae bacterium RA]|nr:hypothetical protein AWN76_002050 [Rhodothermaceae bacterium RA]
MPLHCRVPLFAFLLIVALASGCGLFGGEDEEPPAEVVIEDLEVGTGPAAAPGQTLTVHYVGRLENGTTFDSSRERDQPFTFVLGDPRLIQGWNDGIVGMREGGLRRITIPPALGYGARGSGSIPPNATLIFEIELLDVTD